MTHRMWIGSVESLTVLRFHYDNYICPFQIIFRNMSFRLRACSRRAGFDQVTLAKDLFRTGASPFIHGADKQDAKVFCFQ